MKKPSQLRCKGYVTHGGVDGARTRDLRIDSPAL